MRGEESSHCAIYFGDTEPCMTTTTLATPQPYHPASLGNPEPHPLLVTHPLHVPIMSISVAIPSRLRAYIDYTHHLGIPLVTAFSRPQLQASFARFERGTPAIIPKGSVLNPEFAKFMVGRLKLRSEKSISSCSKHLKSMPVHEMLRDAAVSAMGDPTKFSDIAYQREPLSLGVASKPDCSPLKVDISGMCSPFGATQTNILAAMVVDRTHRLEHFTHVILKSLSEAGFCATAYPSFMGLMMTRMLDTYPRKGTYDRKTGRWNNKGRPVRPKVDASNLIQGWNDFEWATNVQLEKICIYELGMTERLPDGAFQEKQKVEVASVMLP